MGIDWNPIGKPCPGCEEEYEKLYYLISDIHNELQLNWLGYSECTKEKDLIALATW